MCLCFCGIVVFSAENDFSVSVQSGYYNSDDNCFVLNYVVKNNCDMDLKRSVIFSVYDEYENFAAEKIEEIYLEKNTSVHKRVVLKISKKVFDEGTLKVFLWKDTVSMLPVGNVIYKNISEISSTKENVYFDFSEQKFIALGKINEETTVDGITFIGHSDGKNLSVKPEGCVYFYGGGNKSDCSLKFDVKGKCKINFFAESVSDTDSRFLKVNDGNKDLAYFEVKPKTITKSSLYYDGEGASLYVASKSSGINLYIVEILYDYDDIEELDNVFYADDFSSLTYGIFKAEVAGGGKVFIKADTIDCYSYILLKNKDANITICGAEGFKAVLDFEPYRDSMSAENTVSNMGIFLTGSGYTIKNIIVQNAPGSGVKLFKESCCNNFIENVVLRYNDGKGICLSGGASNNIIKNCYSYRNCDIFTLGNHADGFVNSVDAGKGNKFIDCYAWENSDDGFDFFADYEDVTLENCFVWHNGDPDVYTGKYDFDRGRNLDEKLRLVKIFEKYDMNFKSNYEKGIFELPEGEFITVSKDGVTVQNIDAASFAGDMWSGNPNGFKLGSGDSKYGPKVDATAYRYMKNCIAFDHIGAGFDKNNSACTAIIENALSFDNKKYDYLLNTCTLPAFSNAFGYNGKNRLPDNVAVKELSADDFYAVKEELYSKIERLEKFVYNDEIPRDIGFEKVFNLISH